MQKYRSANYTRHLPFSSLGNVVAYLMLHHDDLPVLVFNDVAFSVLGGMSDAMLVEPIYRVNIRESKERACRWLEVRVESLDEISRTRIVEKRVYCLTYLNDNNKSSNGA
jgi:hypothetical protein